MGLCTYAFFFFRHEFSKYSFREVRDAVRAIPQRQIVHAALLTALSYLVLTGYDALAMKDLGIALSYRNTAFASFVGYVFSHNIGLSVVGGGAARYRLYSAFGLSAVDIFKIVAFCAATFWLGMLFLTGSVLTIDPSLVATHLHLPDPLVRAIGVVLIAAMVGYVFWCHWRRAPVSFRGWSFTLPITRIAITQIVLSAIDWLVAASVLYSLLPAEVDVPFHQFLGVYLASIVLAAAAHVPGGIGVFEGLVLKMLSTEQSSAALFGSLIAFRCIYYLLPLGTGALLLGAYELGQRLPSVRRVTSVLGRWGPAVVPNVLALSTFVGGTVLLVSGATPAEHANLEWLAAAVPLSVVELSHFLGSIVGVLLLLLAHGLQQRINFAWFASSLLLVAGIALSLLKGLDWQEALTLAIILGALLPCRREFTRQASLLGDRFTLGWIAALLVVLASSAWLAFFSHKHLDELLSSNDPVWWKFALHGDAPRSLRATVGAAVVLIAVGVTRLLRPAAPMPVLADAEALARALPIVRASGDTLANLALLGDKTLLFNDARTAFLMYAVQGRSWVALGDPVGPVLEAGKLVWDLRERSHRAGGAAAFYQVLGDHLPLYLELGFTALKLGEEARVPLADFSLDGGARKGLRHSVSKVEESGARFEFAPTERVAELVPELARVSFDWLETKKTREKGFSLGYFSPDYLRHFPVALVKQGERIVAFANLWLGGGKEELSVDLMRYDQKAPAGVTDYLFTQLMAWGRDNGYAWFNLGMAPLSGLDPRPLAPLWNKIGSALFRHGEPFYNFQGLRQYKEKYDPLWRPRYLATPGGLSLPATLTNVATLIAGGVRGIVGK